VRKEHKMKMKIKEKMMNIKTTVKSHKKKILITCSVIAGAVVIAAGSFSIAEAATSNSMKKIAAKAVPSTATFKDIDHEDGCYELEYYDKTNKAYYDVTVSSSTKKVTLVERECGDCSGSAAVKLSESDAEAAVKNEIKDITEISSTLAKEDGLYEYRVDFSGSGFYGTAYVDPADGTILKSDYHYGTRSNEAATSVSGLISEKKAESIVLKKLPGATITEIELDNDHSGQYYEGTATLGNHEYEFEIDASSGTVTKWNRCSSDHDGNGHDGDDHDNGNHHSEHDDND
jgi:uncharacterized membrane protein YkoI